MVFLDLPVLLIDLGRHPKVALPAVVGFIVGLIPFLVIPKNDNNIFYFLGSTLLGITIGLVWQIKTEPE